MEVTETTNELVKVVETSGVEAQTAITLKEKFLPFFEQAEEWKRKAEALVVTDISQTADMKMARIARLALKEIRVNADKTRKELKEDGLRYGKAVQGVYNVIEFLIAPIEKHLQEQEDFAAIQEAKKRAELKANREMELQPFAEFVPMGLDLGAMSEADYDKTLNGAKLQLQAKIEAERIAKEKAEAKERERIRIENEKLKAEALAKEKQLAEERAKAEAERKAMEAKAAKAKAEADAKLKAEKEANEKLQAEIRAKAEAERKAKKEAEAKVAAELKAKELADKKAKAAPDKAKLNDFAKLLDELTLPELKSEEAQKVLSDAKGLLQKVSTFIREKSSII